MLHRFLPFFILIPITELWLLFKLAQVIGFFSTLLLVISTAVIGVSLLRQQGMQTLMRFQQRLQRAQMPIQEMLEGLLLFFAGGLLLTPGIVTDCIGFILLIPAGRKLALKFLSPWVTKNVNIYGQFEEHEYRDTANSPFSTTNNESPRPEGNVIEGEYHDLSRKNNGS